MRCFLAGLLILALSSAALGQVRGEVESVGLGDGFYRPQCWTPMVIRLRSQISEPAEYRIEIHQHDLDFDHVTYVKDGITLNGQATQRWEVYFLPEPIHGGLPDGSAIELQDRLHVYLTNKDGSRRLLELPITSSVQSLEAITNAFATSKAARLVLVVTDGSSRPALSQGSYDGAIGMAEHPAPAMMRPDELPQNVLGYQAVDAVVWISGDANVLSEEGSKQLVALRQWVRQGGRLIVCQPGNDAQRLRIAPFADMLPIEWMDDGQWKVRMAEKDNLEPLISLAAPKTRARWGEKFWNMKGKFAFARAIAKPAAVVNFRDWIRWGAGASDMTPYIARIAYGLGSVTWVAQDLGNPTITGPDTMGWPYVWDEVFGWASDTRLPGDQTKLDADQYREISYRDLGAAQIAGVEFGAKGAGLVVLAMLFFIVYWIVAGPGSYLLLVRRKKPELSWGAFGVAALAATALTILVVRVVLRGSPEIHHASDVRIVAGRDVQPAIIYSRMGVYIPRDGSQTIALNDTSDEFVSYVTPMPAPPSSDDNDFPANLDYNVPIPAEATSTPVAIDVPFRSTLKKLAAKWCGQSTQTIRGNAISLKPLAPVKNMIQGTLDNLTGVDLKNVYIAFHHPNGQDYVLYVPQWPAKGAESRIDLAAVLTAGQLPIFGGEGTHPTDDKPCWGDIRQQWAPYWQALLKPSLTGAYDVNDLSDPVPTSFPVLSFFGRILPFRGDAQIGTIAFTLLRRGARNLDMSQVVSGGGLVVLAQGDHQPLPFPLTVDGDKIGGDGTVFYQFALPLNTAGAYSPALASRR